MSKRVSLKFNYNIEEIQPLNSSFSKAIISIAYAGENRNNSKISKEVFENALPTIKNIPIVAFFNEETEDFEEHSIKIKKDESGNVKAYPKTIPLGVVAESCKQWWSPVEEDDGTIHEYLFTEAYLWTRQEEYDFIKEKQEFCLSMEINIQSYTKHQDGLCEIHDMEFEALCILGEEYTPCFEKAYIQLCKDDDGENISEFKLKFSQMLNEIKNIEDGGEIMSQNDETIKTQIENEGFEDGYVIKFSLSHEDLRTALYKALNVNFGDNTFGYITKVYDNYFEYEICDYSEENIDNYENKFYRQSYNISENNEVSFVGEPEEIFIISVTAIEKENLEKMKSEFSEIKTENEELKNYKKSIEELEVKKSKNEVFSKWDSLIGDIEDFTSLKNSMDSYSLEEVETKCKCIFADNKATFSIKSKEKGNGMVKVHVSEKKDDETLYYGGLIERFK